MIGYNIQRSGGRKRDAGNHFEEDPMPRIEP
jgi:hypothetical protein